LILQQLKNDTSDLGNLQQSTRFPGKVKVKVNRRL